MVLISKALDKNGFNDEGVKAIVESTNARPHIDSLSLCKYKLTIASCTIGSEGFKAIANSNLSSIELCIYLVIKIGFCSITDSSSQLIASAIKKNQSLYNLDLS